MCIESGCHMRLILLVDIYMIVESSSMRKLIEQLHKCSIVEHLNGPWSDSSCSLGWSESPLLTCYLCRSHDIPDTMESLTAALISQTAALNY